jgi:hypothetical protein
MDRNNPKRSRFIPTTIPAAGKLKAQLVPF